MDESITAFTCEDGLMESPTSEGECMNVLPALDRRVLDLLSWSGDPEEHCEDICSRGWPLGMPLWFTTPCTQLEVPGVGTIGSVQLAYSLPWGLVVVSTAVLALVAAVCCCIVERAQSTKHQVAGDPAVEDADAAEENAFAQQHGCELEDARFFLDAASGDAQVAAALFREHAGIT